MRRHQQLPLLLVCLLSIVLLTRGDNPFSIVAHPSWSASDLDTSLCCDSSAAPVINLQLKDIFGETSNPCDYANALWNRRAEFTSSFVKTNGTELDISVPSLLFELFLANAPALLAGETASVSGDGSRYVITVLETSESYDASTCKQCASGAAFYLNVFTPSLCSSGFAPAPEVNQGSADNGVVTITGENFGTDRTNVHVQITPSSGTPFIATTLSVTDNKVVVSIPAGTSSVFCASVVIGPQGNSISSNCFSISTPEIDEVFYYAQAVDNVVIVGTGFGSSVDVVLVGSAACTVSKVNDTTIVCTVSGLTVAGTYTVSVKLGLHNVTDTVYITPFTGTPAPTPAPTPAGTTPAPTPTGTAAPTPTGTAAPTPTGTPAPTPTGTAAPTPTGTAAPTPTGTPAPTSTGTAPTPTSTGTAAPIVCLNGGSLVNSACVCVGGFTGSVCQTSPAYPISASTPGTFTSQVSGGGSLGLNFNAGALGVPGVLNIVSGLPAGVSLPAAPSGFTFGPQVFQINFKDANGNEIHTFPGMLNIEISAQDVTPDTRLYLLGADNTPVDAAATCTPEHRTYTAATHTLVTGVCHLTTFVTTTPVPPPTVLRVMPWQDVTPGTVITISGVNFGDKFASRSVMIGGYSCLGVRALSTSTLTCTVPPKAQGANLYVVVIVNGIVSQGYAVVDLPTSKSDECQPPFGSRDSIDPTLCNCWSGHAPSGDHFDDCSVDAKCATIGTQNLVGSAAPQRPITSFGNDRLYILQKQPIGNRRDTHIKFVPPPQMLTQNNMSAYTPDASCGYPGTLWKKKVSSLDCVDEYHGEIPWTQNQMCGFVKNNIASTPTMLVYSSIMQTTHMDVVKDRSTGSSVVRAHVTTYEIDVAFTRKITILNNLNPVQVYFPTSTLQVDLTSSIMMDVSTNDVMITFKTTLNWPYQFDAGQIWQSGGVANTFPIPATAHSSDADASACNTNQDSDCEQNWLATIPIDPLNPSLCKVGGKIVFPNLWLVCRDDVDVVNCPAAANKTELSLVIGTTDFCNPINLDASEGVSSTLTSYYDLEQSQPTSEFQVGDMIYLDLAITSPLATVDMAVPRSVSLFSTNNPTAKDLIFSLDAAYITGVELNYTSMLDVTAPNTAMHLPFRFRLLRNKLLNSVGVVHNNNMQNTLQIEIVVDISYHGNQKRSVRAVVAPGQHRQTVAIEVMYDDADAVDTKAETDADVFGNAESAATMPYLEILTAVVLAVVHLLL